VKGNPKPCFPNPCKHGGVCRRNGCICRSPWGGPTCEGKFMLDWKA